LRYTYLALVEAVRFTEDRMDFKSFAIRRFSREELAAILQSGINQTFYPHAQLDTATLKDYSFIYVQEEIEESPFVLNHPMEMSEPLKRKFTEFPKPVEAALRILALYDWKSWMMDCSQGWFGFNIPFVLTINDNLLEAPRAAPDLAKLHQQPSFDADGNELGLEPNVLITMNTSEGAAFFNFISQVEDMVAKAKGVREWDFVGRALDYLVKAYISEGLEQLLWHITVLDALLGTQGRVTESLRRRVPLILGREDREREIVKSQVKNLYKLRSDLVHGNTMMEDSGGRLAEARNLARRTALYFMNYLASILTKYPACSLSREKILEMIDIGKSGAPAMSQSLDVLNALPEEFPSVAAWS
jgi:hypothetical protein